MNGIQSFPTPTRRLRVLALGAPTILAVIAAIGCGTKTHQAATPGPVNLIVTPAPQRSAAPSVPRVFPGRTLGSLSLRSSKLVKSSARVLLNSADGSVSLIAGRSRTNRLCAGAFSPVSGATTVRCLNDAVRPPVIGFIAMTGRTRAEAAALRRSKANSLPAPGTAAGNRARLGLGVRSSSVVGLADPSTARVVLVLQDNTRKTVKLQRLPGLPWRVFSAGPYENMAPDPGTLASLPSTLVALDRNGRTLGEVELSSGYPDCRPDLCANRKTKTGNWVIVRDPFAGRQDRRVSAALGKKAKRILLSDPAVRQIVSGRQHDLGAFVYWPKCDGTLIGAYAQVFLARPVSIEGELPAAFQQNGTGSAYVEGRAFFDVSNVRELRVGIDVNRNQIVSIDPTAGGDAVVKKRKLGKLHSAGGPDTRTCPSEGG